MNRNISWLHVRYWIEIQAPLLNIIRFSCDIIDHDIMRWYHRYTIYTNRNNRLICELRCIYNYIDNHVTGINLIVGLDYQLATHVHDETNAALNNNTGTSFIDSTNCAVCECTNTTGLSNSGFESSEMDVSTTVTITELDSAGSSGRQCFRSKSNKNIER